MLFRNFLIFDGNQKTLRQLKWLNDVFEEPYIRDYAAGCVDGSMRAAGFAAVQTQDVWRINQVTSGVKPIIKENIIQTSVRQEALTFIHTTIDNNLENFGSPVFGTKA